MPQQAPITCRTQLLNLCLYDLIGYPNISGFPVSTSERHFTEYNGENRKHRKGKGRQSECVTILSRLEQQVCTDRAGYILCLIELLTLHTTDEYCLIRHQGSVHPAEQLCIRSLYTVQYGYTPTLHDYGSILYISCLCSLSHTHCNHRSNRRMICVHSTLVTPEVCSVVLDCPNYSQGFFLAW